MAFWRKYKKCDSKNKWFVVNAIACLIAEDLECQLTKKFSISLNMKVENKLGIKVTLLEYIRTYFTRNYRLILTDCEIKEYYKLAVQILYIQYYKRKESGIIGMTKSKYYDKFDDLVKFAITTKIEKYKKLYTDLEKYLKELGYNVNRVPKPIYCSPLFALEYEEPDFLF